MSVIPLPPAWNNYVKSGMLLAIALARFALMVVRGWCANSPITRVRLAGERDQLRSEVALLLEELRIKDSRIAKISPRHRPFYPPTERLAILALQAARGWNMQQVARRFLVTSATIATWRGRLEEDGPKALVQSPTPVNRFPEFVTAIVQRLKVLCPLMGKSRIAQVLARAGLHLAATTVSRMLRAAPAPPAPQLTTDQQSTSDRTVQANYPHHAWNLDLTTVPVAGGFWVPWFPRCLAQCWPWSWWVLVIVDHFSRAAIGFALFSSQPTAQEVCAALLCAARRVRSTPKYIITDHGSQFQEDYRQLCARSGIKPRYGAVGKYGSIAVVERFIRTIKQEGLRRLLLPPRFDSMRAQLLRLFEWYNTERPHTSLQGATPSEVLERRRPANRSPRFEPRARYPTTARCAAPKTRVRGEPGCKLELIVTQHDGAEHLPIVRLKRAA